MDIAPSPITFFSVFFKFVAIDIGVIRNVIGLVYTILLDRQKTATSCLAGNLALVD